jgi:hypothetical protein
VTYELNAYCDNPHAMARLYTALCRIPLFVTIHILLDQSPIYDGGAAVLDRVTI